MANILWRDDDISVDTDLEKLRAVQNIFEKHGQREVYSVVPIGRTIYEFYDHSIPLPGVEDMTGRVPLSTNKDLVRFLKESIKRGHKVSLHGCPQHSRVTDYEDTIVRLAESRKMVEDLLEAKIEYFVPPFNHYDASVLAACEEIDLPVSRGGGQLEKLVEEYRFEQHDMYWFHYWRFNNLERLDRWLEKFLST